MSLLEYNEVTEKKFIVHEGQPYEVISSHVFRKQQRKPVNATKLKNLMNALEEMTGTPHGIHNTPLFDEEPETTLAEITEANVREALMAYAAKYDVDDKMANTLVDGPDILKKTFGPAVSALRLVPKDSASLRKAYDAIHDAVKNNWYNRKVVG